MNFKEIKRMSKVICIILAAHPAPQLTPLTENTPKALLHINGRPLIDYNLSQLSNMADQFVIVTNHFENLIQDTIGHEYKGKKVEYVHQNSPTGGTLDAFRYGVYSTHDFDPSNTYIVSNCDDIHGPDIYRHFQLNILTDPDKALISAKIIRSKKQLNRYGIIESDPVTNNLIRIVEKPTNYISSLVNTGIYYFPSNILECLSHTKDLNPCKEQFITEDLLNFYSQAYPILVIATLDKWLPMSNLEDFEKANRQKIT